MHRRRFIIAKVSFIISLLLLGVVPNGRAEPHKGMGSIRRDVLEALAQRLHFDPDGPEMRRLFAAEPALKSFDDGMPVVKHLRGKSGTPFTPMGKLIPRLTKEQVDALRQHQRKQMANYLHFFKEAPAIPECSESKTSKEETVHPKNTRNEDSVTMDMLFISKSDVPTSFDSKEALGAGVVVQVLDLSKPSLAAAAARNAGVTCLPYRFRVTKRARMRDQGINALYNYGEHPYSRGKLHASLLFLKGRFL